MHILLGELLGELLGDLSGDLLQGGVTLGGLKHNIAVGILFIEAWLRGTHPDLYLILLSTPFTVHLSV